ncbi:MAG: entericidin [Asticcacaulis sp.]
MKRLAIISLLALLPAIAACHTLGGMGHDVKDAGAAVQSAASQ